MERNLKKRLRIKENRKISEILVIESNGVSQYKDPNHKKLSGAEVITSLLPLLNFLPQANLDKQEARCLVFMTVL